MLQEPLDLAPLLDRVNQLQSDQASSASVLVISISRQVLYLVEAGELQNTFSVSTSKFGTGNKDGSLKTPLGMHRISDKIGEDCEPGTVFRGRKPCGRVITPGDSNAARISEDLITTRILRLQGMEPGVNSGPGIDSYERYIYIHGTPHESLIGQPASHGCIRMTNADVLDVFKRVAVGSLVLIEP